MRCPSWLEEVARSEFRTGGAVDAARAGGPRHRAGRRPHRPLDDFRHLRGRRPQPQDAAGRHGRRRRRQPAPAGAGAPRRRRASDPDRRPDRRRGRTRHQAACRNAPARPSWRAGCRSASRARVRPNPHQPRPCRAAPASAAAAAHRSRARQPAAARAATAGSEASGARPPTARRCACRRSMPPAPQFLDAAAPGAGMPRRAAAAGSAEATASGLDKPADNVDIAAGPPRRAPGDVARRRDEPAARRAFQQEVATALSKARAAARYSAPAAGSAGRLTACSMAWAIQPAQRAAANRGKGASVGSSQAIAARRPWRSRCWAARPVARMRLARQIGRRRPARRAARAGPRRAGRRRGRADGRSPAARSPRAASAAGSAAARRSRRRRRPSARDRRRRAAMHRPEQRREPGQRRGGQRGAGGGGDPRGEGRRVELVVGHQHQRGADQRRRPRAVATPGAGEAFGDRRARRRHRRRARRPASRSSMRRLVDQRRRRPARASGRIAGAARASIAQRRSTGGSAGVERARSRRTAAGRARPTAARRLLQRRARRPAARRRGRGRTAARRDTVVIADGSTGSPQAIALGGDVGRAAAARCAAPAPSTSARE